MTITLNVKHLCIALAMLLIAILFIWAFAISYHCYQVHQRQVTNERMIQLMDKAIDEQDEEDPPSKFLKRMKPVAPQEK